MHLPSLKSVLFALLLCGLVVPTGAVVTDGARDDVFEQNGLVLKPADGPNGEYASIGDDGNITIDITDPGVNDDEIPSFDISSSSRTPGSGKRVSG